MGNMLMAAAPAKSSGGFNGSYLILILIVVVGFYLLMIRPQQRRRQQAAQQQNTVQPGARVRTTAGMYATVVDVDGDDVILEVAPGIEVRYMKRAIMDVVSAGEETEETLADSANEDGDESESAATDSDETDSDETGSAEDGWAKVDDDVAETGTTKKD